MTFTVGFIGLGNMGRPMAANLCRGDLHVLVHDIMPGVARKYADDHSGAAAVTSPSDFASCDVIITMLPTGVDVANALLDSPDPIATHLRTGSIVVDTGSRSAVGLGWS
jgi:3-hydroxyisobutyrate dehydrogenase